MKGILAALFITAGYVSHQIAKLKGTLLKIESKLNELSNREEVDDLFAA